MSAAVSLLWSGGVLLLCVCASPQNNAVSNGLINREARQAMHQAHALVTEQPSHRAPPHVPLYNGKLVRVLLERVGVTQSPRWILPNPQSSAHHHQLISIRHPPFILPPRTHKDRVPAAAASMATPSELRTPQAVTSALIVKVRILCLFHTIPLLVPSNPTTSPPLPLTPSLPPYSNPLTST